MANLAHKRNTISICKNSRFSIFSSLLYQFQEPSRKPRRIERSVHPGLAKRGFFVTDKETTESTMSFAQFIEHTKTYNKDGQFPADAPKEIVIYEVLDHTASAKLSAAWGIDYMHLAKYNGKWMIVHVLWQTHPQNEA